MSSVISSSSSSCHPITVGGGIVGLNLEGRNVERDILEAVPRHIPSVLANLIASYISKAEGVFAESDWNKLCGRVAPAPPLPPNMEEIWEGLCPIFPGERVKDTHLLVYLPTTVDDKPLTLKVLGAIAKQLYFPRSKAGYKYIWEEIMEQMGDQPVDTAKWVLMTKKVIKRSKGASYEAQKTMIIDLANKTNVPYTVPTTLQATICILTHYMRTGERLFSDGQNATYTRCQENLDGYQSAVGGFSSNGLVVYGSNTVDVGNRDNDLIGVAALCKFLGP